MTCEWVNPWRDSGDRGAAQHDHDRQYHPDHKHEWGWSRYEWEQKGEPHIAPGDKTKITPRPQTVVRCEVCAVGWRENKEGQCGISTFLKRISS
jgi:hypothetical protein